MAPTLLFSHLRLPEDLRKLRKLVGWQVAGYEDKVRCGIALLTGMRPDGFMYFSAYALFWAGTPILLLLLHVAGDVWTLTAAPVATLHHLGGYLCASLRNVHCRVAICAPL
jgi:hypothetical protein